MDAPNLNQLWANLLVEELARNDVRHFIIAPGSRSAPLAVAAARNKRVNTLVHFDERGAAFAALGSGRMGKTAAVICSSGTAVANCFPAVAEARQAAIPLVIISADRPPELHGCGANQTMEQEGIFGSFLCAETTLPCPTVSMPPESVLIQVDDIAAAAGVVGKGGPVHLNCMFREPLAPEQVPTPWPEGYTNRLHAWENDDAPFSNRKPTARLLSHEQLEQAVSKATRAQRGLLLIGGLHTREEEEAVCALVSKLQWPAFADITSNCRRNAAGDNLIAHYDLLLRSDAFRTTCTPDVVLHIGDVFVSKRLYQHLEMLRPEYIQLIARSDVRDPIRRVTCRCEGDIVAGCRQLTERLATTASESALLAPCRAANERIRACATRHIEENDLLTELSVATHIAASCRESMALFLGNSMPIRDMDMAVGECCAATIQANRGVSGIDGNIAAASGMAWASGLPTLAVTGDMAALHDMNSLALLAKSATPVILIIINNQGGGIFSFLPIADHPDVFDAYFTNSHNWRFDRAAATFGLPYTRVATKKALKHSLLELMEQGASAVIEVSVARPENVQAHNALFKAAATALDGQ